MKSGPQSGQRVCIRVAARPFIDRKYRFVDCGTCARAVRRLDHRDFDRDDFVDEAAAVDRRDRTLMAGEREAVLLLARDA